MDCVSLEIEEKIRTGFDGSVKEEDVNKGVFWFGARVLFIQVRIQLNVTGKNIVHLFFYDKNNVFLPSTYCLFGSAFAYIRAPQEGKRYSQNFYLEKIQWLRIDSRDYRCNETETEVSVEACLNRFIEDSAGCSSKYQTTPPSKPVCTTMEQYRNWTEWLYKLKKMDETSIHAKTGCLATCNYNEYDLSTPSQVVVSNSSTSEGKELSLALTFPKGKYEVRELYYVYDQDSFIADVGGYLGLLLGHSIFSIVCSLHLLGDRFDVFGKFFAKA